jgi:transposase
VIDASGKIVREAKVASEPVALIAWLGSLGLELTRIGLEAGPLSQWLYAGMREAGLVVELLETRHVRNAFKIMPVKTDRKDAHGIAELMRLGWMSSGTVERSTAAPDSSATTGLRPAPQPAAPALGRLGAIDRLLHGGRRRLLAACRPRRSKVSRNPRRDGHGHCVEHVLNCVPRQDHDHALRRRDLNSVRSLQGRLGAFLAWEQQI